jgi:PAS domain S-box-containing protein
VIVEAAALGVGLHLLRRRDARWVAPGMLWAFGLLVHVLMLALQVLLLPGGSGWEVLWRVGPTVLNLYPIATVLICRIFLEREVRLAAEIAHRASEERYATTLLSIGDGVVVTAAAGQVELLNPVAERLTGWTTAEAAGRPLEEVFRIVHEETRTTVENPVRRAMREGAIVGLANHTILIAKDGTARPIADSAAPIRDRQGTLTGVVLVFRDQTAERAAERESRLLTDTLRASPNEIYIFDGRTLAFRFVNDGALRNLGYSLEAIRHLTPVDLKPEIDAERFAEMIGPCEPARSPW